MARARKQLTLDQAQELAVKHAADYISKTPLGLPASMDEAAFEQSMNAITRGIVGAWIAGWMEGSR